MQTWYLWKDRRFLLVSFCGSVILGALGFLVLPELMQYLQTHTDKQTVLWVCFFIAFLACSVLFLGETSYIACKLKGVAIHKNRKAYYSRVWSFLVTAAAIYLAASLLDGMLSVLISRIFANSMTFETHKAIIDFIISQLTLLVMPVIIAQLFAFSLYNLRFFKTIAKGFSALHVLYLRLLLVMIGLFIFGILLGIPARLIDNDIMKRTWLLLSFGVQGTLAIVFIFQVGLKHFMDWRRK